MHITYLTLGRILQLSTEGVETRVHDERETTLRLILGRKDVGPLDVVSANQLSPEMRLLHSIVTHILFPKIGQFDFISERELIIMHCILEEYLLNLPKLMITHMIEGFTKRNACLPYGMVPTLLFQDFKVPIPEDEPKRLLRHTDIYSIQSLIRMGFRKINGEWKRSKGRKKAAEEGESNRPSVSHQRPQSRQTNSLDQTNFTQLSEMIQQGFDKFSQQMSQMDKRISTLEDHIL